MENKEFVSLCNMADGINFRRKGKMTVTEKGWQYDEAGNEPENGAGSHPGKDGSYGIGACTGGQ